jgi:hypothetical protein
MLLDKLRQQPLEAGHAEPLGNVGFPDVAPSWRPEAA